MRNLHSHFNEEFGEESVFLLQQWEKIEKKMVDFCNHKKVFTQMFKERYHTSEYKIEDQHKNNQRYGNYQEN